MTKTMTAAAALLLGVALAASAQANNTMRQSTAPANDTQQTAQTGTTAAPQATKHRATRKITKRMTAHRQLAGKSTGKQMAAKVTKGSKLQTASLKRHKKPTQMARLHHRSLRGQQQSTEIGSSTMPSDTSTLNTLPPTTNQPLAGSGSSMMPPNQNPTLPPLNQSPTQTPPIR
jgi:hypothetical protein